jgi:release factor glutamine methyltransferase
MKVNDWLAGATENLEAASVPSARLDCLILLEDTLHKDRAYLLAHPEVELHPHQLGRLNRQVKRRSVHEPLAYIRGFTEFYGRKFRVNKHVLEPRPESETMIELLKTLDLPNKPKIADVGTGSGCLGITAALELHDPYVDLYDIDSSALAVAKHNTVLHELHLHAHKRDLLNRPARDYEVILANLPYVPTTWKINEAARHEPRLAIFGGKDGLDLYRRLFEQLSKMDSKLHFVLTESLPSQHEKLALIAEKHGYHLLKSQGFIQVFTNN